VNSSGSPRLIAADELVRQTVGRLLDAASPPSVAQDAEAGLWPGDLWRALADGGFAAIGGNADEPAEIIDAMGVLIEVGRHATPLPVAETGVLGGWLLAVAGREQDSSAVTLAIPHRRDTVEITGGAAPRHLRATFHAVPWAGAAERLLVAHAPGPDSGGEELVLLVERRRFTVEESKNIAGEPRDIVHVDCALDPGDAHVVPAGTVEKLSLRGAFSRAALMSGAMARCVDLAVGYARVRHQFGQPIIRFQSVAHLLAIAAEQCVLAESAVQVAAESLADDPADAGAHVAVARSVAAHAARVISANAHQVFGAIGVTQEHELQLYTRRLWAWEGEWGGAREDGGQYGQWLLDQGADGFWDTITGNAVARPGQSPELAALPNRNR
jgi:acyl-CoA dehydrogenase